MFSYWEQDIFKPKYDFIIIGAGFSGLWLAYYLKKQIKNVSIAIFEKGILPSGASTKNAGFACFGSPSELLENVKDLGIAKAMELTKKRYEGIQIIKENFGRTIDYNACGASELFIDNLKFDENANKIDFLNSNLKDIVGHSDHFYLDETIIKASNFVGFSKAISNDAEAGIHSGKLVTELFKQLVSQDVRFFFGSEVEHIDSENITSKIKIKNLGDFEAKHVSVCTNAFSNSFLPNLNIKPGRGQVLITKPIANLPFNKTFHFDAGYYYFRNVGNRVLFGGGRNLDFEGENTESFGTNKLIIRELENYLATFILPNSRYEIDQTWSGIMAFNASKTPFTEIIKPNLSASVAMNGMGVALAPYLSKDLAEKLCNLF